MTSFLLPEATLRVEIISGFQPEYPMNKTHFIKYVFKWHKWDLCLSMSTSKKDLAKIKKQVPHIMKNVIFVFLIIR